MEIKEIPVLPSGVTGDYLQKEDGICSCFDYPMQEDVYERRLRDLQGRTFGRRELVSHLLHYNEQYGASAKTLENIRALENSHTVVVIGGQQAGILTGPLYTIHKIVSILQLAKQQEEKLGVRVIPVFWIAGEDHDIDEINHVHVMKKGKIKKSILPADTSKKVSATETRLNHDQCLSWVESVFSSLQETNFTLDIMQFVKRCLQKAETYTDFFALMITELFKEEGLVLIDSGNEDLRKLEVSFFEQIVNQEQEISESLAKQQEIIKQMKYTPLITTKSSAIHLFIKIDGERWLLEKDKGEYISKGGEIRFTRDELLQMIRKAPEIFSNNVVTRPLMQEYLFPTLAFIGGPGEIAYWSELQQVFHVIGWKMPPVVPRLMISYAERHIEEDVKDLSLKIEDVFTRNIADMRDEWLQGQVEEPFEEHFKKARGEIEKSHRVLREVTERVNPSLAAFAEKNKRKIAEQLQILERALQKDIETKNAVDLNKFRRIESSLKPMGALQERTWNIIYFLNKYGLSFVNEVVHSSFIWNGMHKVVKL